MTRRQAHLSITSTTLLHLTSLIREHLAMDPTFSLSMMDRHYHSGMSVEEAINLVDKCIMEI
uniref:Proteasome subunit beta type-2-B n=1 Tax=Rhizophora mucronata TaxID=61149 RepID=A0A2P2QMC3_RHIMU